MPKDIPFQAEAVDLLDSAETNFIATVRKKAEELANKDRSEHVTPEHVIAAIKEVNLIKLAAQAKA